MRKINVLFIFLLGAFFFSCEDNPDHITVTLNESGNLTVKVVDKEGNPLEGARLVIHDGDNTLYYELTDETGIFEVGKMIQGFYSCYASIERNGLLYYEYKNFQIISGNSTQIELNPLANSGNVTFDLYTLEYTGYDEYEKVYLSDAIVVLSSDSYPEDAIRSGVIRGKTDANGKVRFEGIPVTDSYSYYYVHAYNSDGTYRSNNSINIRKGESTMSIQMRNYY